MINFVGIFIILYVRVISISDNTKHPGSMTLY